MQEVPSIDSMLNADLTGVDTSFPVLEAGIVSAMITKCYTDVSKEKKTPGVFFEFSTLEAHRTTSGQTRAAGFLLRDTIWLTPPKHEGEPSMALQRLAQVKEAVFGAKDGPFGEPAMYVGKPVTFRLGVESSEQYGNKNVVKAYVKLQN